MMDNSTLLIEQLLGDIEEEATGIFRKVLDNGREVYTCKCPVCGALHGGYHTFAEAYAHRKCKAHFRSEIDKLKKEIEKVDDPPKKRDMFTQSVPEPAVLGEEKIVYNEAEDGDDLKSLLGADIGVPGEVTKLSCLDFHLGQQLWHRTRKTADGAPRAVRVSGRCRTWSTRPNEFRLPVKHGLYSSFYITDVNAGEYTTICPDDEGEL